MVWRPWGTRGCPPAALPSDVPRSSHSHNTVDPRPSHSGEDGACVVLNTVTQSRTARVRTMSTSPRCALGPRLPQDPERQQPDPAGLRFGSEVAGGRREPGVPAAAGPAPHLRAGPSSPQAGGGSTHSGVWENSPREYLRVGPPPRSTARLPPQPDGDASSLSLQPSPGASRSRFSVRPRDAESGSAATGPSWGWSGAGGPSVPGRTGLWFCLWTAESRRRSPSPTHQGGGGPPRTGDPGARRPLC